MFIIQTDIVSLLQVSKKYVSKELAKEIHAKAAPFVKWLKEAEEESGGSEEEEVEDDENVEVTDVDHFMNFVLLYVHRCVHFYIKSK